MVRERPPPAGTRSVACRLNTATAMASHGPNLGDLLNSGLTFAICVIAGLGLGWLVDWALGTFPAVVFIGLLLGIVAAFTYIYQQFKRYS